MKALPSLIELVSAVSRRESSCETQVRQCMERIAAREPLIHAWAHFDAEQALAQARALDAGTARHRLHGVPAGV